MAEGTGAGLALGPAPPRNGLAGNPTLDAEPFGECASGPIPAETGKNPPHAPIIISGIPEKLFFDDRLSRMLNPKLNAGGAGVRGKPRPTIATIRLKIMSQVIHFSGSANAT
jgi:hypothetical protein